MMMMNVDYFNDKILQKSLHNNIQVISSGQFIFTKTDGKL